jgi:hypothetical protein
VMGFLERHGIGCECDWCTNKSYRSGSFGTLFEHDLHGLRFALEGANVIEGELIRLSDEEFEEMTEVGPDGRRVAKYDEDEEGDEDEAPEAAIVHATGKKS